MHFPDRIYSFKVNNRNARIMCEIYSKLTKMTPERREWRLGLNALNILHTLQYIYERCLLFSSCHIYIAPFLSVGMA